ncbi:MAG: transposase family protein, partial [Actinobacteria bacterium]|nr:transposase family protein [Actinomycetota bacterium]
MRVNTAFNNMLGIVGASVASVSFAPEGVVVGLRRRRRRPVCPCGWKGRGIYDRRVRRWRHLDLAGTRCWLEAEVRRLACRRCRRVRTEEVSAPTRPPRGRPRKGSAPTPEGPRRLKHTRWTLVKDPDDLTDAQLEVLHR